MLNIISDLAGLEAALGLEPDAEARTPFSSDACLPSGVARTSQMRGESVVYRRPRAFWAANVSGQRRSAADQAALAFGQPSSPSKHYPHTTRIAAGGGTKGPHPEREPEPA
jgi:hypothetical protein